jgi:hypothetical protein
VPRSWIVGDWRRLSLCCARRDCRQRATPPSMRFLGPKVYVGAVVVLVAALRCGPTPARCRLLEQWVGVSRHTIVRWRQWWTETLIATPFWRAAAAALMPPVVIGQLPASLLGKHPNRDVPCEISADLIEADCRRSAQPTRVVSIH